MARKKTAEGPEILKARADEMLHTLRYLRHNEQMMVDAVNDLIKEAAGRYREDIEKVRASIGKTEAELIRLMKEGRTVFFADGDILPLPSGSLIHALEQKVILHGKKEEIIARAEAACLLDAIKIEKSLDRDKINKWPDDRLAVIGGERKAQDTYNYDLKK